MLEIGNNVHLAAARVAKTENDVSSVMGMDIYSSAIEGNFSNK